MSKGSPSRYHLAADREWRETPDGVRYARFSSRAGDPGRPLVVLSELPPGHVEPPHTHESDYIEIILEGTLHIGKTDMGRGDARSTQAGTGYGPLVAGPEGCVRLTIFETAAGSAMRLLGKGAPQSG
ncbi:MAG TPA: hypothetical protein VGE05_02140 [Novosphingobium sp.]